MMNPALRIINYVMLACFVLAVIVQYNDPDPLPWMIVYAAAALSCGLFAAHKAAWPVYAITGLVALLWSLTFFRRVIGKVAFSELFEAWEMKDVRVEEGREMGGLLIVAAWMLILTFASRPPRNYSAR